MSTAAEAVQAALVEALSGLTGVSGIYDGPPARAAWPFVSIDEGETRDWSHKTGRGRVHGVGISVWDDGLEPSRLHLLLGQAQAAIEAMPSDLEGHRIVSLVFLRARVTRDADGPWRGQVHYRLRTLEV